MQGPKCFDPTLVQETNNQGPERLEIKKLKFEQNFHKKNEKQAGAELGQAQPQLC